MLADLHWPCINTVSTEKYTGGRMCIFFTERSFVYAAVYVEATDIL